LDEVDFADGAFNSTSLIKGKRLGVTFKGVFLIGAAAPIRTPLALATSVVFV